MNSEKTIVFAAPVPVSSARLIKVLGSVAMISGLLIVLVYQLTLPTITEQRRKALEDAVLKVIPDAQSVKAFVVEGGRLAPAGDNNKNALHVYLGYDKNGDLQGIAAAGSGQGYADAVKILYGYSPACECITGFNVVASRETPGFGDKLSTDAGFLANFQSLDARLNADKSGLAHEIVTVKHGTKTQPWQVDAISGATVSSRAVGRALNDSASQVLPVLVPRLDELRHRSD
jgi:electron transport complex protein RnfG